MPRAGRALSAMSGHRRATACGQHNGFLIQSPGVEHTGMESVGCSGPGRSLARHGELHAEADQHHPGHAVQEAGHARARTHELGQASCGQNHHRGPPWPSWPCSPAGSYRRSTTSPISYSIVREDWTVDFANQEIVRLAALDRSAVLGRGRFGSCRSGYRRRRRCVGRSWSNSFAVSRRGGLQPKRLPGPSVPATRGPMARFCWERSGSVHGR